MFYETRIQHENIDGRLVRENYLVHAESFAEADSKIQAEYGISADDVLSIRRSPIAETHHEHDAGDFYRIRLVREYTRDNGRTVTSNWYIALRAVSTDEATQRANDILAQGYTDLTLADVIKTRLLDVI